MVEVGKGVTGYYDGPAIDPDPIVDGIKSVQGSQFNVNGETYNPAGQRVGNDYKGIVIRNGKKLVK